MPDNEERISVSTTVQGHHLCFRWSGGPYIDWGFTYDKPLDVINVWDGPTQRSKIAFTREGLMRAIDAFERDLEPGELDGYWEHFTRRPKKADPT